MTRHRQPLVAGQALLGKPGAARGPAEILMRAGRDQMGVQDRLDWMMFFSRERCRTIWLRRVTWRRSA
jgi:hypothetical protein